MRKNFPDQAWENIDIDFNKICEFFMQEAPFLNSQYQLLKKEFLGLWSADERAKFIKGQKDNNLNVIKRFEELTDPQFICPDGKEEEINKEANALHLIIKYEIWQGALIAEYKEKRMYKLIQAILDQGYSLDPHTGEIINVVTGETIQESQF